MTSGNSYQVNVTPKAERDIESIITYLLDKYSVSAVTSWVNEFSRIRKRLAGNPYQYQSYFLFIHRINFRRFPYFVAYAVDSINQEVDSIMVAHQQQSIDHLARRLTI